MSAENHTPHPHLHDQREPDPYHVRGTFAGRIGFVLAAAGSAVGLGNIIKFPWLVGEQGGSIFILVYLICIVLIGMPVMLAEFTIGRAARTDQVTAYTVHSPGTPWCLNGLMGLMAGAFILAFYCPVAGWVLAYGMKMLTGRFDTSGLEDSGAIASYYEGQFGEMSMADTMWLGMPEPIWWTMVIFLITGGIIALGVEAGIERASKMLMPALLLIMVLLAGRSLTLDGAEGGLAFLFKPDFSKLTEWNMYLEAMGQAFFTLSLAMGAMMTYASYLDRRSDLAPLVVQIASLDTLIALLAGLMIFPAVFAFDMDPSAGRGVGLIFITLPTIFDQMWLGGILGVAFFLLLTIAAITSIISLVEPLVTWFIDGLNMRRVPATLTCIIGLFLISIPTALSVSADGAVSVTVSALNGGEPISLFDVFDKITTNFAMPLGGLVICLFVAFGWRRAEVLRAAVGEGNVPGRLLHFWYLLCMTLTPVLIFLVLLNGLGILPWALEHLGIIEPEAATEAVRAILQLGRGLG